ncbi:MAG: hypothetical protein M3N91_08290 [Pseudomonadota bacterium]|nr:hypothetical protein [Pseudomonadota bacterium]
MSEFQFKRLLVTAILVAITVPIYAQQAPEPAKAPANSSPAAPAQADISAQDADAAAAAAAIAKKAKAAGWRPEMRSGVTVYCRQDAEVGSRFTKKRCATETQLAAVLERQEYEREQFRLRGCGGHCGP